MATFDDVVWTYSNWNGGYQGNAPTNATEYNNLLQIFPNVWIGSAPAWSELESAIALGDVQKLRRNEYPSLEDVTVALAELQEGNAEMWDSITASRQEIKAKYPKP